MAGQSTGIKQTSIYATWTPYGVTCGVTAPEPSAKTLNLGRFCPKCGTAYTYHNGQWVPLGQSTARAWVRFGIHFLNSGSAVHFL